MTIERIGYANVTTDRFTTGADEIVLDIDVPIEPVLLTGLDVEAGRRCEVRPEEGQVTARVWEEVRKAPRGRSLDPRGFAPTPTR